MRVGDPFAAYTGHALADRLTALGLGHWNPAVSARVDAAIAPGRHGDLQTWRSALTELADLPRSPLDPASTGVATAAAATLAPARRRQLEETLKTLQPWRKGPFRLYGVEIDAEWRSDLKWSRVATSGVDLRGRRILDVGCGNSWYAWRMLAAGAASVVGVDPTLKYVVQAWAVARCLTPNAVEVLPLSLEDLPPGRGEFDRVFSMGVIYHRRAPMEHLATLRSYLAPGGVLLLESLVVPGGASTCLIPLQRYARMRNVWFVPSAEALARWLRRSGFDAVEIIDERPTTTEEQRATAWMPFESLAASLDPADPTRTVEGYPAPRRALLAARRSS